MPDLKFGVTVGGLASSVAQNAQRIEALGFDSLWMGEHVVWRTPTQDSLTMLAAAAVATSRVRLGTSIVLLPLKHPVLLCKAVTTLDHISGGRVSLGIGIGGEFPKEFEAVGVPVQERGPRANESLELMKRLWTEEQVTFHGRFFHMEEIGLEPKPVQRPHPPVLVGGRRRALRRVARFGDGWMPYMYTPEMYREDWGRIEDLAVDYGRDPARIEQTLYAFITIDKSYEAAAATAARSLGARYAQSFDTLVHRYAIAGTPEQCAARLEQFREAGASHFILAASAPPEQSQAYPEIIAQEIIPRLRPKG